MKDVIESFFTSNKELWKGEKNISMVSDKADYYDSDEPLSVENYSADFGAFQYDFFCPILSNPNKYFVDIS